jgi:hypothetical protein
MRGSRHSNSAKPLRSRVPSLDSIAPLFADADVLQSNGDRLTPVARHPHARSTVRGCKRNGLPRDKTLVLVRFFEHFCSKSRTNRRVFTLGTRSLRADR